MLWQFPSRCDPWRFLMRHAFKRDCGLGTKDIDNLVQMVANIFVQVGTFHIKIDRLPTEVAKPSILAEQDWTMDPSLEVFAEKLLITRRDRPRLRIVHELLQLQMCEDFTSVTRFAQKVVCNFVSIHRHLQGYPQTIHSLAQHIGYR